jgi:hypothetical protein
MTRRRTVGLGQQAPYVSVRQTFAQRVEIVDCGGRLPAGWSEGAVALKALTEHHGEARRIVR